MSLMFQPLRRYADFMGRASRTEYWLFQLLILGLCVALAIPLVVEVSRSPEGAEPSALFSALIMVGIAGYLALFIPRLAVLVRRLHDSGNSGFWVLIDLIPGGGIVLLVLSLWPGTVGPNQHGPDPRGRGAPTTRQAATVLETFD